MALIDHRTVRSAREDRGLTQKALGEAVGLRQANIAAIENGTRPVSAATLRRILEAADYRPSLPLALHAAEIIRIGAQMGITDVRVFGSISRGEDHNSSDIDLLVSLRPGAAGFEIGAFASHVEELTGFAVDIVVDRGDDPVLDQIRQSAQVLG